MLDDSSCLYLAIGAPSLVLAVSVLVCILEHRRQRKFKSLRLDVNVDRFEPTKEVVRKEIYSGPKVDDVNVDGSANLSNVEVSSSECVDDNNDITTVPVYTAPAEPVDVTTTPGSTQMEELSETNGLRQRKIKLAMMASLKDSITSDFLFLEPTPEPKPTSNLAVDTQPETKETTPIEMKPETKTLVQKEIEKEITREASPTVIRGSEERFWQKCKNETHCKYCNYNFGLLTRRHHCRRCHSSVCANCSGHTSALPDFEAPQRVCNQCWNELSKNENEKEREKEKEKEKETETEKDNEKKEDEKIQTETKKEEERQALHLANNQEEEKEDDEDWVETTVTEQKTPKVEEAVLIASN